VTRKNASTAAAALVAMAAGMARFAPRPIRPLAIAPSCRSNATWTAIVEALKADALVTSTRTFVWTVVVALAVMFALRGVFAARRRASLALVCPPQHSPWGERASPAAFRGRSRLRPARARFGVWVWRSVLWSFGDEGNQETFFPGDPASLFW